MEEEPIIIMCIIFTIVCFCVCSGLMVQYHPELINQKVIEKLKK